MTPMQIYYFAGFIVFLAASVYFYTANYDLEFGDLFGFISASLIPGVRELVFLWVFTGWFSHQNSKRVVLIRKRNAK